MKKKNLIIISLIAVVILATSSIFIIYGQSNHENSNSKSTKLYDRKEDEDYDGKNAYYRIKSRYGVDNNPGYLDMFNTDNSLERLKLFNTDLNEEFDLFEFYIQPLDFIGYYNGDKRFVNGNELGSDCINQKSEDSSGNKVLITPLKTFIIGKLRHERFKDLIDEGRTFDDKDYVINKSDEEISIILGNEYKDIYNVGDVLTLSLHEKKLKLKVIGFFKKDTKIKYQNAGFVFDTAIVIPFYDITYVPEDKIEEIYQKTYYSQKNEGLIKINGESTDDVENVKATYLNKFEELANKYDLLYTIPSSQIQVDFPQ